MKRENHLESCGKIISLLSDRMALKILAAGTKEEYLLEPHGELAELTEASMMLEILGFPIPQSVNEVIRVHHEGFID